MITWRNFIPDDPAEPIHVAPFASSDAKEPMSPHVLGKECPCNPQVKIVKNGREAIVHKVPIQ